MEVLGYKGCFIPARPSTGTRSRLAVALASTSVLASTWHGELISMSGMRVANHESLSRPSNIDVRGSKAQLGDVCAFVLLADGKSLCWNSPPPLRTPYPRSYAASPPSIRGDANMIPRWVCVVGCACGVSRDVFSGVSTDLCCTWMMGVSAQVPRFCSAVATAAAAS